MRGSGGLRGRKECRNPAEKGRSMRRQVDSGQIWSIHRSGRRGGAERRKGAGEERFLLVTITQTMVCAAVILVAFAFGNLLEETGTKETLTAWMTEESRAVEVLAQVGEQIRTGDALDSLREKAEAALSFAVDSQEAGGQGGYNPVRTGEKGIQFRRVLLSAPMAKPLDGFWISCPFGDRIHPITGEEDRHTGVDLAVPAGTAVHAVYPGVVSEVGESRIYGNYIVLDHGNGVETTYNHCETILASEGQVLRQGDRIALAGSTGVSTGPHLHLELRVNGVAVDPMDAANCSWSEETNG